MTYNVFGGTLALLNLSILHTRTVTVEYSELCFSLVNYQHK